jgi:3-deoxy-manno-octulosonate cytidylyltransferase (CMP-KDO synthetase)
MGGEVSGKLIVVPSEALDDSGSGGYNASVEAPYVYAGLRSANMSAVVIIPARYGSTRFAAKILAAQTGRPLVQHVVDQAKKCRLVREVIVATDDQRIADALTPFGTRCVMTSPNHPSGTDRIAEVARSLSDEIVVNVQGDEPEIEPEIIDALIERLQTGNEPMATAATLFPNDADPRDPNLVKVVISSGGRALYFSRSAIPFQRDAGSESPEIFLHLGIYAFRRAFLVEFISWPQTPAERAEKLEQLRALEHDKAIFVLKVNRVSHGIDTAEQYMEFVNRVTHRRDAGK